MRIHSDHLSPEAIYAATKGMDGVTATITKASKSRSRKRRFDVRMTGNSRHWNASNTGHAATWDEWGLFIDRLFRTDPDAIVGMYPDYETFRDVTYCRFDDFEHTAQPRGFHEHTWEADGLSRIHVCSCGAQFNWGELQDVRKSL